MTTRKESVEALRDRYRSAVFGDRIKLLDAIKAAQAPHRFLSASKAGHSAIVSSRGHEDRHAMLRSGKEPNFKPAIVEAASREPHCLRIEVAKNVAGQRAAEF